MKRIFPLLLLVSLFVTLFGCSRNLAEKGKIIALFQQNEALFLQAAQTGEYTTLEGIDGIERVYTSENYVDISCGGDGFGPSTHYYGIFYSEEDDLCAIDLAGPKDELVEHEGGYLYQQENGANRYYVELLENHFYYYEAHF